MDCSHQDIYILILHIWVDGWTIHCKYIYIYIYINPDKMGEEMMSRHMLHTNIVRSRRSTCGHLLNISKS